MLGGPVAPKTQKHEIKAQYDEAQYDEGKRQEKTDARRKLRVTSTKKEGQRLSLSRDDTRGKEMTKPRQWQREGEAREDQGMNDATKVT